MTDMKRQGLICIKSKCNSHFPQKFPQNHTSSTQCSECQHTWKPEGVRYKGTDIKVIHGRSQIRLLGIRYNMWLDSTTQRRYLMDRLTEMACYLHKIRDLAIENSLRLVACILAPLLAFSGPIIIWPQKKIKRLTAAFVRCNKEAWHMSPNTSTALFTFPRAWS